VVVESVGICPRCQQGTVDLLRIRSTSEVIQVCAECEATWSAGAELGATSFRDLSAYLGERGLSPLGPELEEVDG
jgi:ribosomal protein L37AE/L43A